MYLVTPGLALVVVQFLSAAGGAVTNAIGGVIAGRGGGHQAIDVWSMGSKGASRGGAGAPGEAGGGAEGAAAVPPAA
jgi:hypothetical protein